MSEEKKPFKVVFAPGADADLPPDVRDRLLTDMQAMLDLGGPDALMAHFKPRAVRFVDVRSARCAVCHGVLTQDKDFDDEYECTATAACKDYVYADALSEPAQRALERLKALGLEDE